MCRVCTADEHGSIFDRCCAIQTFQVSKPCNRQPLPLSVSRGVRSRPLGEGIAASAKTDTIPLLSPTMESELLKEPWVFPRAKASPSKEEDTATFSAWEEDFQDLSGWCMDTFQAQCDFHIGESTTFKLSGTYPSVLRRSIQLISLVNINVAPRAINTSG